MHHNIVLNLGVLYHSSSISCSGVALGASTKADWVEMGAAIVAGMEAGWVSPVINQVGRKRGRKGIELILT